MFTGKFVQDTWRNLDTELSNFADFMNEAQAQPAAVSICRTIRYSLQFRLSTNKPVETNVSWEILPHCLGMLYALFRLHLHASLMLSFGSYREFCPTGASTKSELRVLL